MISVQDRLDRNSIPEPNSGCFLWIGAVTQYGYAQIGVDKKIKQAHRVAYELAFGPIPTGLTIDHLCRTRSCVNPAHLEAVTSALNVRRAYAAKRLPDRPIGVTCPNGHPWTPETTSTWKNRTKCKVCDRDRWRAVNNSAGFRPDRPSAPFIADPSSPTGHRCQQGHTDIRLIFESGRKRCFQCARDYAAIQRARRKANG